MTSAHHQKLRTNREILTSGKSYVSKKKKSHSVEEVLFDKDSRLDFLTGFHKRKVERQKKAQDFIKEQERQMRIEERKRVRDERKKDMEGQLIKLKESMKEVGDYVGSDNENDIDSKEEEEEEEWNGFDEEEESVDKENKNSTDEEGNIKPILRRKTAEETLNFEDETQVEIESLEPNENFEFLAKLNHVKLEKSEKVLNDSINRANKYAKFLGIEDTTNKTNSNKVSKKKKKFRYLTKNERRENQRKANRNKYRK
ncbi:related to Ribosomal RNA-processing protein 17 [Saccharomycodes ludwigii]|uniref:Related to Ribosomal RNA-processing protein 17 n=1 Tax=Saccharomycodes ludwigii TaxID=36035 RepID=A0A376B9Z4_9ASCO|nr:related to Ribosomal RNA-processing protein 17 [Saccharomycodes ludwigii]